MKKLFIAVILLLAACGNDWIVPASSQAKTPGGGNGTRSTTPVWQDGGYGTPIDLPRPGRLFDGGTLSRDAGSSAEQPEDGGSTMPVDGGNPPGPDGGASCPPDDKKQDEKKDKCKKQDGE